MTTKTPMPLASGLAAVKIGLILRDEVRFFEKLLRHRSVLLDHVVDHVYLFK